MSRTLALTGVVLLGLAVGAAAQEGASRKKTPGKGDAVVAKGCLSGPTLQSTETVTTDDTGLVSTPVTYQLKGDKTLLKKLREELDGKVVSITGQLKSALPQDSAIGSKTVGKTKVSIGVGTQSSQPGVPVMQSGLPVLEVQSFEGMGTTCRSTKD